MRADHLALNLELCPQSAVVPGFRESEGNDREVCQDSLNESLAGDFNARVGCALDAVQQLGSSDGCHVEGVAGISSVKRREIESLSLCSDKDRAIEDYSHSGDLSGGSLRGTAWMGGL